MSQSKAHFDEWERISAMSEEELDRELEALQINVELSMSRYRAIIFDMDARVKSAMFVPSNLL